MEIIEFRYLNKNDHFDESYIHWSRQYEYPTAINYIQKYHNEKSKIHNTSWGCSHHNWYNDCHLPFKEKLDQLFESENVVHSDIYSSDLPGTTIFDVTKKPNVEFESKFDFVLSISALEEIRGNHIKYLNNLFLNLKTNGYLIVTFDLPGFQLSALEDNLRIKISKDQYENRIIGHDNLNVGLFVAKMFNPP